MEDAIIIARLLNDPAEKADPLWVNDMMRRHPTFMLPALLLLKRNPQDLDQQTLQRLESAVSLNCADRKAVIDYIDPSGQGWASMYPQPQPVSPSTEQTINDFICAYGTPPTPQEEALLEKLIMTPAPADYFVETDEPFDPNDPLALPPELMQPDDVDTDTEDSPEAAETPEAAPETKTPEKRAEKAPAHGEDTLFMESLAKIFIKQQRYERAYEIISKLSLNYPEKSVYFADQLRFLQKLMINQRHKTS